MNREIKFRGLCYDTQEWAYGSLLVVNGQSYIAPEQEGYHGFPCFDESNLYEVDPSSVGQWTGCYDSSGFEIYEWDMLDIGTGVPYVVHFEKTYGIRSVAGLMMEDVVITGNVHELEPDRQEDIIKTYNLR